MAAEISKLAVVLTGNIAGFSASMKTAGASIDALKTKVAAAGSAMASSFASTMLKLGSAIGAIGAITYGVKLAAQFEQAEVAMSTMLKSATAAKILLADLSKFAAETPFEFPELADAAKKLLAFGSSANILVGELRILGDIASGIGAPIGEIAELYGKARVQGRLMAEDINQLTNRGIPIIQQLAKQFGVSESAVRGLVETGRVGFANLMKAFIDMTATGGQFAGMMEAQSRTIAGLWSTLKDSVGTALRSVADILIRELNVKEGMKSLIVWCEQFGRQVGAVITVTIRWSKAHWEQIVLVAKWAAGITAAIYVIGKLFAACRAIVIAYKAITTSQVIMHALSGPKGWAILAAGAAIAAGAVYKVSEAYNALANEVARVATESGKAALAQGKGMDQCVRMTQGQIAAAQQEAALADAINKTGNKLAEQAQTMGMSSSEIDIWKLKKQGATEEQLKLVRLWEKELKLAEEATKAMNEWAQAAKNAFEETRTPLEKLEQKEKELGNLLAQKLIDQETYTRAMQKAEKEYEHTFDIPTAKSKPQIGNDFRQPIVALERRFTAGFQRSTVEDKWTKHLEATAKFSERTAKATEDIAKQTDPVVAIN